MSWIIWCTGVFYKWLRNHIIWYWVVLETSVALTPFALKMKLSSVKMLCLPWRQWMYSIHWRYWTLSKYYQTIDRLFLNVLLIHYRVSRLSISISQAGFASLIYLSSLCKNFDFLINMALRRIKSRLYYIIDKDLKW